MLIALVPLLENGFRNQDLGTKYAYSPGSFTGEWFQEPRSRHKVCLLLPGTFNTRSPQPTEQGNICVHIHIMHTTICVMYTYL